MNLISYSFLCISLMSYTNCISNTACCLIIFIFVFGAPLGILIDYLVVKVKDPTFTLEYASVSGFNLTSDDHLTAFFDVVIRVDNPNHFIKLKYKHVRIWISKSGQIIAEDALDGLTQRKRNVTLLRSEAMAIDVNLKKAPAFDIRFEGGLGYLDFYVSMTAKLDQHLRVDDDLTVTCHSVVNVTTPAQIAASPTASNFNKDYDDNFPSTECSVYIERNDEDD